MDATTYKALYEDEYGEVIGIDEMQLLDEPPPGRVPQLRALLRGDDAWVAFQAAEVLTAWGDDEGMAYFERLVPDWPAEGRDYYPHRIYGYDDALDHVADAASVYLLSGGDAARATALFRALLARYGPVVFESRLKAALLKRGDPALAPDVRAAIARAEAQGRPYLASQLLPVLARWEGRAALPVLERFLDASDRPNPRTNVAEALRYVDPAAAGPLLARLAADPDRVVADEARASLQTLGGSA